VAQVHDLQPSGSAWRNPATPAWRKGGVGEAGRRLGRYSTRTECPDGLLAAWPDPSLRNNGDDVDLHAGTHRDETGDDPSACNGRGEVPLHDRVDSVEVSRVS
jgi:hypothetical protein